MKVYSSTRDVHRVALILPKVRGQLRDARKGSQTPSEKELTEEAEGLLDIVSDERTSASVNLKRGLSSII